MFKPKKQAQKIDKGKYEAIQGVTSEYGAFIPFIKGKMRITPICVWSSGIQVYTRTTTSGSTRKGEPSSSTTEYIYQTSIALLVCGNPIQEYKKIWADTTQVYSTLNSNERLVEAEDATRTGGASVVSNINAHGGKYVTNVGNGGKILFEFSPDDAADGEIDPPPITIPYTDFQIQYKSTTDLTAYLSFSGGTPQPYTFENTNGSYAIKTITVANYKTTLEISNPSAAAPDIDYVYVLYYRDYPNQSRTKPTVTGLMNPQIKYPADLNDPSAFYNYVPEKDEAAGEMSATTTVPQQQVRFYYGSQTQTQDSAIVSWLDRRYGAGEGVKRTSAMRGFSYIVIENYTIPNGRVPNFSVEVDEGARDLADYVTFLYEQSGIDTVELELDALEGLELEGFIINQFTPAAQTLRQLEIWFGFRMVEIDGVYRAVLESDDTVKDIPAIDLRAHSAGEEMPMSDCEIKSIDERNAPLESIVNFLNPDYEYHNDSASDSLEGSTGGMETKEQNFPFTADPEAARTVATRELLKDHLKLKSFPFSAMPGYARIAPCDRVRLLLPTRTYEVIIEKKQMALPGRAEFEAVLSDKEIYEVANSKGARADKSLLFAAPPSPNFPRNSKLIIIESIPLTTENRGELGLYMGVSGRGLGNWTGAEIYKEVAEDVYQPIGAVGAPSPIGVAQDTLGDWATETELDDTNSLTILFFDAVEFESVDGGDAFNNPSLNLIRIGDEWLQFTTATAESLPDNSIYRSAWTFTDFWRGRFGTVAAIGSHGGDEFACAVTDALKWRRFEPAEIGETLNFKAVTNGQSVELAPIESITLQAISLQPLVFPDGYTITKFDSRLRFSNRGATSQANFGLPLGIEGFVCSFVVEDEDALAIQPTNPDTILFGGHAATFGEYLYSTTVGSFLTLRYTNGVWIAEDITGVWSVND